MNIRQALLERHGRETMQRIVRYVGNDPARFADLLYCALGQDRRLTECAVWPLGELLIVHPSHLRKNWSKILKLLTGQGHHPAVYRNMLRALQFADIPEKYTGKVLDCCFAFIGNEQAPVAVRANAITVAAKLCAPYPELTRELKLLLDELARYPLQAALRVRIRDAKRLLQR